MIKPVRLVVIRELAEQFSECHKSTRDNRASRRPNMTALRDMQKPLRVIRKRSLQETVVIVVGEIVHGRCARTISHRPRRSGKLYSAVAAAN